MKILNIGLNDGQICVACTESNQKQSELFSLISTALFVALYTEGSKMCFNCINCNVKLIQHRLIKFSGLKRCRINHAEVNERPSKLSFKALVESRKQLTSLL